MHRKVPLCGCSTSRSLRRIFAQFSARVLSFWCPAVSRSSLRPFQRGADRWWRYPKAIAKNLEQLKELGIQILWQTGEFYFEKYQKYDDKVVRVEKYFDNISLTYDVADLLIVRAGATTIAEVAALELPVIFVPSTKILGLIL